MGLILISISLHRNINVSLPVIYLFSDIPNIFHSSGLLGLRVIKE